MTQQNIDSTHPTENHIETLADSVLDDYMSGPDHEAEPDPVADARFKQFVITFADDPLGATLEYWHSKDAADDPFIHAFLSRFGLNATFGDLWAAMSTAESKSNERGHVTAE